MARGRSPSGESRSWCGSENRLSDRRAARNDTRRSARCRRPALRGRRPKLHRSGARPARRTRARRANLRRFDPVAPGTRPEALEGHRLGRNGIYRRTRSALWISLCSVESNAPAARPGSLGRPNELRSRTHHPAGSSRCSGRQCANRRFLSGRRRFPLPDGERQLADCGILRPARVRSAVANHIRRDRWKSPTREPRTRDSGKTRMGFDFRAGLAFRLASRGVGDPAPGRCPAPPTARPRLRSTTPSLRPAPGEPPSISRQSRPSAWWRSP